jgi:hypothetical protein
MNKLLLVVPLVLLSVASHAASIDIGPLGAASIAFDSNDNLWVLSPYEPAPGSSFVADQIKQVNIDTGQILSEYYDHGYKGITFDANDTMYLLGNSDYKSIASNDGIYGNGDDIITDGPWPFGGISSWSAEPISGDFDSNGNLIIAKVGIPNEFFTFNLGSGTYSSFLSPFTESSVGHYPRGIAVAPNGNIYVATISYGIEIYSGATHEYITSLTSGLGENELISGIAFDSAGQLWIASNANRIYTYGDASRSPNPVPEPSTVLLLGCGLTGLVWFSRKHKNT